MLKSSSSPGCDSIRETNHGTGQIKLLISLFNIKYHVLNSTAADRSLQFSMNGTPGRVDIRDLTSLEAFTIGFWMKTDDKLNKGTPFSYGTSENSNELILYNYQEFQLIIHGESR